MMLMLHLNIQGLKNSFSLLDTVAVKRYYRITSWDGVKICLGSSAEHSVRFRFKNNNKKMYVYRKT